MKKAKTWTVTLPPNGEVKEAKTIMVAHYWPMGGYGAGTRCETFEVAMAEAKRQALSAEATGKCVIHIIETFERTTVVRP